MDKMEKILDREVAWRIFAFEFNRSNLYMADGDERAPNYIITPTGVKCNRLFIVGVVTEIENIGHDNNLWRARIADPTGVFSVYAGQYQSEAAIFLSELQVPAYVAVVGKARKFEPEVGSVYVSVRPEEINSADEKLRNRWVLDTAERTLERIHLIEEALRSGTSGDELKVFLMGRTKNLLLVEGAAHAIQYYKNLPRIILELKRAITHAVESIMTEETQQAEHLQEIKNETVMENEPSHESDIPYVQPEPKEIIAEIIDKLDTGKGTSFTEIIETAKPAGIDAELVESCIKQLMDEGRCYEPKIGILRKV